MTFLQLYALATSNTRNEWMEDPDEEIGELTELQQTYYSENKTSEIVKGKKGKELNI